MSPLWDVFISPETEFDLINDVMRLLFIVPFCESHTNYYLLRFTMYHFFFLSILATMFTRTKVEATIRWVTHSPQAQLLRGAVQVSPWSCNLLKAPKYQPSGINLLDQAGSGSNQSFMLGSFIGEVEPRTLPRTLALRLGLGRQVSYPKPKCVRHTLTTCLPRERSAVSLLGRFVMGVGCRCHTRKELSVAPQVECGALSGYVPLEFLVITWWTQKSRKYSWEIWIRRSWWS